MSHLIQSRRFCWMVLFCGLLSSGLPAFGQAQQKENLQKESISSLINKFVSKGRILKGETTEYQDVKDMLLKKLQDALDGAKTQTEAYALAMLIAELAEREYDQVGDKLINEEEKKLSRGLTDNLVALAKNKDWRIRYVALRTLGKIAPDPDKVVPLMKANLLKGDASTASLESRRVAAYALVDLARYAQLLPRTQTGKETFLPLEQMRTISQVVDAASLGIVDEDELVRGYSLLAVIESANSLKYRILPQQKPSEPTDKTAKIEFEDKGFALHMANKEFRDEFGRIFVKYASINDALLVRLHDPSGKVQQTALEAIEGVLSRRAFFILFLRSLPGNEAIATKQLFKSVKLDEQVYELSDPMKKVVFEDSGRTIVRLLDDRQDVRLRRQILNVLELLGLELDLLSKDSDKVVMRRLLEVLRNPREDMFVRWSAVSIVDNLIRAEQNPTKVKLLLKKVIDNDIDGILCRLLAVDLETRSDADLAKATALALVGLAEQSRIAADGKESKRLADEYINLLNHVFFSNRGGTLQYDIGLRYDADTRRAILRAVVSLGSEDIAAGIDTVVAALEKDPDPRIRRAAADALRKFGPAADRAIPALMRALNVDDDSEVRMNASETVVSLTRAKKK